MDHLIREPLKQLPPPCFDRELDVRRSQVLEWLRFVQDFGHVDVRGLIARVGSGSDDSLVAAIEAVAATGSNAAEAYDAVRNFVVQRLLGEDYPVETVPPSVARISPYSVPVELLHGVFIPFGFAETFNPETLWTKVWQRVIPTEERLTCFIGSSQKALLTNLWCRVFPPPTTEEAVSLHCMSLELVDVAANRAFYIPLQPAIQDHIPLFVSIAPNSGFSFRLGKPWSLPNTSIFVFIEGWIYDY